MHRLLRQLLLVCFASAVVSSVSAEGVSRNCVDQCVLELCRQNGIVVSPDNLDDAIVKCGQEVGATYRNLRECTDLLNVLGMEVHAVVVDAEESAPPSGIYYCRLSDSELPGHVIVMKAEELGQVTIFDPLIPEEAVVTIPLAEFHRIHEGIAIVSDDEYRGIFFSNLLHTVGICVVVGALVLIAGVVSQKFVGWRKRNSTNTASLLGLVSLVIIAGCKSKDQADQYVVQKTVDLGIVRVPPENQATQFGGFVKSCEFEIYNPHNKPVKITGVNSGCGCVTSLDGVKGTEIVPGATFLLSMDVRLNEKFGAFEVPVWLRIDGPRQSSIELTIKGIAVQPPKPLSEIVSFESASDHPVNQDIKIVYVRHDDRRAAWKSFELSSNRKASSCFTLGKPIAKEGVRFGGGAIDKWVFPVTYHPSKSKESANETDLTITWAHPSDEITVVHLEGKMVLPVELERYYFFPNVTAGELHLESVPIRVVASDMLEDLSVSSDTPGVECEIKADVQRLNITFDKLPKGSQVKAKITIAVDRDGSDFSMVTNIEALVK